MGIYEVVMEEMTRYTGLSPAAFFTIAGMMVVVYRYVTGMFVPLLMAIKAQIYDVSSSRNFYGPGGPYAMFAGRDASRALALLSFKPQDINGNIQGLGPDELQILQDWEDKFIEKYVKVGQLLLQPQPQPQPQPTDTQQT
ncbi:hypothetical protein M0R45_000307 [Rubus argutus]|uniref:Cytochrome b5 heme-binding domain-containing protein n=1 Tax=Rubus argutus TaxID=59490 RepID=A0AAW1VM66_RUBAR